MASRPFKYKHAFEEDGFKSTLYLQYLANFGESPSARNKFDRQVAQLSNAPWNPSGGMPKQTERATGAA